MERFWAKVSIRGPDECWPWKGWTKQKYGRFRRSGGGLVGAHVMAYELANGAPENEVCHTCNNKPCCNPRHLYDGTHSQNMKDAVADGQLVLHGERSPSAKLTDKQVAEIRAACAAGERVKDVAARYGVSASHVSNLKAGKFRKRSPARPGS